MTDHHDGCLSCTHCGRHLDETEQWPCLDCGRVLCDDHNLTDCIDCRLEAEREMYRSGVYSEKADPFYNPAATAAAEAYWQRPALNMPGSPGFKPKDAS